MDRKTELEDIHVNIQKLMAETTKVQHDLKYDWIKITLFFVSTFIAATLLVLKIQSL